MKQKGVYPYDYIDNFEKFNDTKLPSKDEHITVEDYKHVQTIWKTFKLKNMGQ